MNNIQFVDITIILFCQLLSYFHRRLTKRIIFKNFILTYALYDGRKETRMTKILKSKLKYMKIENIVKVLNY